MSKVGELIEGWVLKIALKKGVKAAGAVILAAVASAKVAPLLAKAGTILNQLGVSVTFDKNSLENGLTILGTAAVTMGLNWLKMKTSLGQKFL